MENYKVPITENNVGERIFPRDFTKKDLERFLYLFSGRNDLLAEEFLWDYYHQKTTYDVQKIPYDETRLLIHLYGKKSLMYYPIDFNLKTNVIIILIDYLNQHKYSRFSDESLYTGIKSHSKFWEIINKFYNAEINPAVELFNRYQLRLWIFLNYRIHFLKARKLTISLINFFYKNECNLSLKPIYLTDINHIHWKEIPIPLPLGIIPKSGGTRRLFINHKTLTFYQDQIEYLNNIKLLSKPDVISDLDNYISEYNSDKRLFKYREETKINALKNLREKCKIIDYLIAKSESGLYLTDDEKKILYYTISFLDVDKKILRDVLSKTPNFKEKSFLRQIENLYPRPISCPKIRELIPNIVNALDCSCIFNQEDLSLGRYPSPILHFNPLFVPTIEEKDTVKFSTPLELAKKFLSLLQEVDAIERKRMLLLDELVKSLKMHNKRRLKVDNIIIYLNDEDNDIRVEVI